MKGHPSTLVRDPAERERRRMHKREQVLRWLRLNTWSTADVLRQVVDLSSRQAVHSLLQGLCRDQLVRKATISGEFGPSVLVWGITAHGAAMAAKDDESISCRTFEPSKVRAATMGHDIDIQRLQLHAERAGWKWQVTNGEFARSEAKYADAVATRRDGIRVAIEVERTVKTSKRYAEILAAHLAARKEGKWEQIYYLCPDSNIRDRVQRSFKELERVKWRGELIILTPRHLAPFKFFAYDDHWSLET